MGLFSGLSELVSNVVSIAVTAFTGNPMFGQIAGGLVSSLLSDSGSTGNSGFENIFNQAFGNAFMNALGG